MKVWPICVEGTVVGAVVGVGGGAVVAVGGGVEATAVEVGSCVERVIGVGVVDGKGVGLLVLRETSNHVSALAPPTTANPPTPMSSVRRDR